MKHSDIAFPKGLGPAGQALHRDVVKIVSALQVQRGKVPGVIPGGADELRDFLTGVVAILDATTGTTA